MAESLTPPDNLLGRASSALQWRLAAAVVAGLFQFAIGVLLARLLAPGDFGLAALAFVFLGLVNLFGDLGIGAALVQRSAIDARHIRTSFTASSILGLAATALVILAAPLGGAFMRNDAIIPVLRVLAIGFSLDGLGVTARALLRRHLEFKRLFGVDVISYVVGYAGVAVTLALLGHGVWSLVWGGIAQSALATVLAWLFVRHPLQPLIALRELRELLFFGVGLSASGIVNYVATNGDNLMVGRLIGTAGLGFYNRAYSLMNLPQTYTSSVLSGVLFPSFAQVQSDRERFRRGYLLASRFAALSAAPIMAGIAVAAPHLIVGLYGARWTRAIVPLQVLCVAGYFRALYHLGGSVAQASANVYQELKAQLGYAILVVGGASAVAAYGIVAVAGAVTAAIIYMYVAMGRIALRITGATWRQYVASQLPGLQLGLAVGVCALVVRWTLEAREIGAPWVLFALTATCAVVWLCGLTVALQAPDVQVVVGRLPMPVRRLVSMPTRVHDRLVRRRSLAEGVR